MVKDFQGTAHLFVSGLNSDGLALLALKSTITDDPENVLANWNSNDNTPCTWNGVRCDATNLVTSLSLVKRRLIGWIPAQLGNLSALRHINLHDNNLFGPLPPEMFNSIFLSSVYLFNNKLTGSLPSSVGQLQRLKHINIARNGFSGEIPSQLSSCTKLEDVIFIGNRFSGSIPSNLGTSLKALQTLDLSFNQLSGAIPDDLGNLGSLQGVLQLSSNRLNGSIPAALGNLPPAVSLNLSNNALTGPIPPILTQQNRVLLVDNNSGLCGSPLNNSCPVSAVPVAPSRRKKGLLSHSAIVAVVVGGSVGILIVILVCFYCCFKYWRVSRVQSEAQSPKVDNGNISNDDISFSSVSSVNAPGWNSCFSLPKGAQPGAQMYNSKMVEPGELVLMDEDAHFDLEQLLRASAVVLGRSGAGVLYKATLEDGITIAVRRLGPGGARKYKYFESKVELLGKIRHPNIVSLRAYYWALDEKLLVYDYIPNCNLVTCLHGWMMETGRKPLNWATRLHIAQGCARGLAHLHAKGTGRSKLVHGQIKPSSILLDNNMEPHISDVELTCLRALAGRSVRASSNLTLHDRADSAEVAGPRPPAGALPTNGEVEETGDSRRLTANLYGAYLCLSSSYYPPEAALRKQTSATQEWDVYSFGVVLLELLTGRSPTRQLAASDLDLVAWVQKIGEEAKPLIEILDPHLIEEIGDIQGQFVETLGIALSCTEDDPQDRPSMREISEQLQQVEREVSQISGPLMIGRDEIQMRDNDDQCEIHIINRGEERRGGVSEVHPIDRDSEIRSGRGAKVVKFDTDHEALPVEGQAYNIDTTSDHTGQDANVNYEANCEGF